jgi:hypothetical protein
LIILEELVIVVLQVGLYGVVYYLQLFMVFIKFQ